MRRADVRGRLLSLLVLLLLLLSARPVAAQSSSPSADADAEGAAAAILALEDLEVRDRHLLLSAAGLEKPQEDGADPAQRKLAITRAVRQLTSYGGWRASVLRHIFERQGALLEADVERKRLDDALAKTLERIETPACKPLRGRFVEYLTKIAEGMDSPFAPLSRGALERQLTPEGKGCVTELAKTEPPAKPFASLDRYIAVSVFATAGDRVWVFSGGDAPEVREVPASSSFAMGERRVFVTFVPRNVPLTLSVTSARLDVSLLWNDVSTDDVGWFAAPKRMACVDLALRLGTSDLALLDGQRVPSGPIHVTLEDHQLIVLGKQRTVIAAMTIARRDLSAIRCLRIPLDLSGTSEGAAAIALTSVRANDGCIQAGVAESTLRSRAIEFLRALKNFKDLDAWAETVRGLSVLDNAITTFGGAAIGADRGRLDSVDTLRTGAKELFRQGFSHLVSIELHCARRSGGAWDYSFIARRLDLDVMQERERDQGGIPLTDVVRAEIETVYENGQLRAGLEAALSRLLGLSYVRFLGGGERRTAFGDPGYDLELYVPLTEGEAKSATVPDRTYRVTLYATPLSGQAYSEKCTPIADDDRLRTVRAAVDEGATGPAPASTFAEVTLRGAKTRTVTVHIDAPATSETHYRVDAVVTLSGVATLSSEGLSEAGPARNESLPRARRCVEYERGSTRLWATIGYAGALGLSWSNARAEHMAHALVIGGAEGELSGSFNIGLAIGYARATHQRDVPPSWDDVAQQRDPSAPQYDPSGGLGVAWVRHSLLLGPTISFTPQWGRFGLVCRLIPVLDLGIFDAADVPPSLPSLHAGRSFAADASVFGQLGLSIQLTQKHRMLLLGHGGVLGLDEALIASESTWRSVHQQTIFDFGTILGGSIGWGFEP